jgi:uncharacterized membrane protein
MSADLSLGLTLFSSLGCGLVAGVFFAFSTFVMKALDHLPPAQAITAMQSINTAAPTAWFMTALFGTALGGLVLGLSSLLRLSEPGALYRVAGCALYLIAILLTIAYHVPRNEALATLDPTSAGAADHWNHYVAGWTAWNHVRTISALGAAAAFALALRAASR